MGTCNKTQDDMKYAADITSVRAAYQRISPYISKTPLLSSATLNSLAGRSIFLKCECFQKGGAFKFRGACNAILSLSDDQAVKGVLTHSSGNHAAAVALAAKLRGVPAYIVIPKNAPKCKVENVKRYGGQVIWSEATMLSREKLALDVQQDSGAVLIHPFNDGRIISGQGTISLEILEQAPDIDTIIVPISGGGLISGVALAAKAINPAIRILAAEPSGADDAMQSKMAGKIVTLSESNTIADGLRAHLGDLTCHNRISTPLIADQMAFISLATLGSWPALLYLCLFIAVFLVNPRKKKAKGSHQLPPGPKRLPIIGNLHQLSDPPHASMMMLARKHGPLMYIQMGCTPHIIVSNAKHAEEVLRTKDIETASRPDLVSHSKLTYNYNDMIFAKYGEYWRQMRKICVLELFTAKKVKAFRPTREEEMGKMIEFIAGSARKGEAVNLSDTTLRLTINVICRIALGKRNVGDGLEILIKEAQAMFAGAFVADMFPRLGWVDNLRGMTAKLEKAFTESDIFYESVIEEHLTAKKKDESEEEDFVDVLLRVQKEFNLTRAHIKGVIMDIFIGATDSSSALIVWVMTELMRNRDILKKAQEEVRRVVGKKGRVEETHVKELPYLGIIIKEALRLHPPGPLLPHETTRDCNLGGYEIPKKTSVVISAYAIGRDPEAWENADEFIPERFMNSSVDYKGQHFQFIPFGSGRRSCPGMLIGVTVVEYTLATLLHSFDWEVPVGREKEVLDMTEASGLTMHKLAPLFLVPSVYTC